jgi:hypothetical protein
MTFELGVHSFGNTPRTADGGYGAIAQAIRHVLEAVHVAEEVGLDFFGFGRQVGSAMSRADIATFLVSQLTDDTYRRASPAISN